MNIKNEILNEVKSQWKEMWEGILDDHNTLEKIDHKYSKYEVFPKKENLLETFKYFDLNETKLVFLGQDPYINSFTINGLDTPQAMGLSFSVPDGIKPPPSLLNIFKELKNEYPDFEIPESGNLSRWVKEEKILLLNTALTVKKGESNSHQKIWSKVTDDVIEYISENCDNIIFLLLGNNAKSKQKLIDCDKHTIITGVHPSPLSASRGFFNSEIFLNINENLEIMGKEKINWKL